MLEHRLKKPINNTNSNGNGNQASAIKSAEALAAKLPSLQPVKSSTSLWQKLIQPWDNLNFQTKLALLLILGTAVPVIAVTQGLTSINQKREFQQLKENLQKDGRAFAGEYVLWTQVESQSQAKNLANLIQATKIDLSNPQQVLANQKLLKDSLLIQNGEDPESNKSFQIFTDAQGRTVAQDIKVIEDTSNNAPLPVKTGVLTPQKYRSVSLPTGINLGNIPIVKDSLQTGRPLDGIELIKKEPLQLLGLDEQANIGLRSQPTTNIPESKQPSPQGTYDIDVAIQA